MLTHATLRDCSDFIFDNKEMVGDVQYINDMQFVHNMNDMQKALMNARTIGLVAHSVLNSDLERLRRDRSSARRGFDVTI